MSCQSLTAADPDPLPSLHKLVHFSSDVDRKSMECNLEYRGDGDLENSSSSWSSWVMSQSVPSDCTMTTTRLLNTSDEHSARFPRLEECAHFHYGRVNLGGLRVSSSPAAKSHQDEDVGWVTVSVRSHCDDGEVSTRTNSDLEVSEVNDQDSNCRQWMITRNAENFKMLDSMLHRCIYDRKVSGLPDLSAGIDAARARDTDAYESLVADYLHHFSIIADDTINCGPILNWFQMDNKGHKLLVASEDSNSINTPAVAAAYSVRRYVSQARDEISFEVGDMISVIDMPGPSESTWWRGKKGFRVGFFPQQCVAVIGDKVPRNMKQPPPIVGSVAVTPIKPVLRKHGKLISLFRGFILNRPSRRALRQQGILKERVFGCDLGEHLLNSGHEVPLVLSSCASVIEKYGCVDGIYRLSGASSTTQKLRVAFDEERPLDNNTAPTDIHAVSSLLKMYFRELPNPLCTYQLYNNFVAAVQGTDNMENEHGEHRRLDDAEKLLRMRETVVKLPPPHYRTLAYLMRHLHRMSLLGASTGMTARNMAIVWAPNLLRSPVQQHALQGVAVQAVVTEFLICYAELVFSDDQPQPDSLEIHDVSGTFDSLDGSSEIMRRPKSLPLATPTRLLSLEEARSKQQLKPSGSREPQYIEVGDGPNSLPRYHTVLQLPPGAAKRGLKRSPSGWRGLFFRANKHRPQTSPSNGQTSFSIPSVPLATSAPADVIIRPPNIAAKEEKDNIMMVELDPHNRAARSCESLTSELDSLPPLASQPQPQINQQSNGHNRSVSCDSYFEASLAELAGMRLRLTSQEREVDIFSEDETTRQNWNKDEASSADTSIEPSPTKLPRTIITKPSMSPDSRKRTKIEDQMSDLLFIDCSTPEHSTARRQSEDNSSLMISSPGVPSPIMEADIKRVCKESMNLESSNQSDTLNVVKMRDKSSPRRSSKNGPSRHSHTGYPMSPKVVTTDPQRHSTLIHVDWPTTVGQYNYSQLQSDSEASVLTRESQDSLVKKLIESKESLSSHDAPSTLTGDGVQTITITRSSPRKTNTIDSSTVSSTNPPKYVNVDVSPQLTASDILNEYEDVPKISECIESVDAKHNVAVTPVEETISSQMMDSLEDSLSPTNISYQNLNRLSAALSGESIKIAASKESTPTLSSPRDKEKTDEVYECYAFTRPSYIHLASSSCESTPSPQQQNKSPIKSTINIVYRSPTKEKSVVTPKMIEQTDGYEDIAESAAVPKHSEPALPDAAVTDIGAAKKQDDLDIYNKVKFFKQSINEVNSLILESENNDSLDDSLEPKEQSNNYYENVDYNKEDQQTNAYENVLVPSKVASSPKAAPLTELCLDRRLINQYENYQVTWNTVEAGNCKRIPKLSIDEFNKENTDSFESPEKRKSTVRQLANKFESPTENKPPFSFDRSSKTSLNSSESKTSTLDRSAKAASLCEPPRSKDLCSSESHSPIKLKQLHKHSTNARSLDENAFVKEFGKHVIHKDHSSERDVGEEIFTLGRRKSSDAAKNKTDLSLNLTENFIPERSVTITPTTENKISLVQARLSPKKPPRKRSETSPEEQKDGSDHSASSTDNSLERDKKDKLSRERIEKYKEERRNFLREKYSAHSFRGPNDIQFKGKSGKDDEVFEGVQLRNPGKLERRNTADAAQRTKYSASIKFSDKQDDAYEDIVPDLQEGTSAKMSVMQRKLSLDAVQCKSGRPWTPLSAKEEQDARPKTIQLPPVDVVKCDATDSYKKEKRSPSFTIKDMAAKFEKK